MPQSYPSWLLSDSRPLSQTACTNKGNERRGGLQKISPQIADLQVYDRELTVQQEFVALVRRCTKCIYPFRAVTRQMVSCLLPLLLLRRRLLRSPRPSWTDVPLLLRCRHESALHPLQDVTWSLRNQMRLLQVVARWRGRHRQRGRPMFRGLPIIIVYDPLNLQIKANCFLDGSMNLQVGTRY